MNQSRLFLISFIVALGSQSIERKEKEKRKKKNQVSKIFLFQK